MKRFALAIALACALSGSALAGDIATPGAPAPGDQGASGVVGDMDGGGAAATGDMGNGIDEGEMGSGRLAAPVILAILDLVF